MTMAPDRHLDIINPPYPIDNDCDFSLFRHLPTELRFIIWKLAAERCRLLELEIKAFPDDTDYDSSDAASGCSHILTGDSKYSITVRGAQLYSTLFRVTRESRQAMLQLYSVHLPCLLETTDRDKRKPPVQAFLYLNLEYDFVQPFTSSIDKQLLIEFVHQLKVLDPRNIGLVNMAVDHNGLNGLNQFAEIGDAHYQAILINTLFQLREVLWMVDSATGRRIIGPMEGFQPFFDMDGVGVRFNHAMPIRSRNMTFDILDKDPRLVGPELAFVATAAGNPRLMRIRWRELLDKCNVPKEKQPNERVLFAYDWEYMNSDYIVDRGTARRFLEKEEDLWLRMQKKWHQVVRRHAGRVPVEDPEELAQATRPAIGFWLFPGEAFSDAEGDLSGGKNVFDLREHWPQLALSHLA